MVTDDFLNVTTDFSLLSLRDLLAARELFHLHLINKPNVVATAVGRYRIRKHPQNGAPGESEAAHPKRTLANSEIRPDSWPSILVFVDKWVQTAEFDPPSGRCSAGYLYAERAESSDLRRRGRARRGSSGRRGPFQLPCKRPRRRLSGRLRRARPGACGIGRLPGDGRTQNLRPHQSPRRRRGWIADLRDYWGQQGPDRRKLEAGNSAASCSLISIHRGPATKSLSTLTSD